MLQENVNCYIFDFDDYYNKFDDFLITYKENSKNYSQENKSLTFFLCYDEKTSKKIIEKIINQNSKINNEFKLYYLFPHQAIPDTIQEPAFIFTTIFRAFHLLKLPEFKLIRITQFVIVNPILFNNYYFENFLLQFIDEFPLLKDLYIIYEEKFMPFSLSNFILSNKLKFSLLPKQYTISSIFYAINEENKLSLLIYLYKKFNKIICICSTSEKCNILNQIFNELKIKSFIYDGIISQEERKNNLNSFSENFNSILFISQQLLSDIKLKLSENYLIINYDFNYSKEEFEKLIYIYKDQNFKFALFINFISKIDVSTFLIIQKIFKNKIYINLEIVPDYFLQNETILNNKKIVQLLKKIPISNEITTKDTSISSYFSDLRNISSGNDTFTSYFENPICYYIDKTEFIKKINVSKEVYLITRPRRFGKSLLLSTISDFFSTKSDPKIFNYFTLLNVSKYSEVMLKFSNYSVIYLCLKDFVKITPIESFYRQLRNIMSKIYLTHKYVLNSLDPSEQVYFESVLNNNIPNDLLLESLLNLTIYLYKYQKTHLYGKKPIILIDEYDPIFYKNFGNTILGEVSMDYTVFLSSALKSNQNLKFGVVTGALHFSKLQLFTGWNNLIVDSILSSSFCDFLGFTEEEVKNALKYFNLPISIFSQITKYYNGYIFGNFIKHVNIYNPFSIINYLRSHMLANYWTNTSNTNILQIFYKKLSSYDQKDFEKILQGISIQKNVSFSVTLESIDKSPGDLIWSYLFFGGYLTFDENEPSLRNEILLVNPNGTINDIINIQYLIRIPNQEVKQELFRFVRETIEGIASLSYSNSLQNILDHKFLTFCKHIQTMIVEMMSFYDFGAHIIPEQIYHSFFLGMFVGLYGTHEVKSNLEAGHGRSDIHIVKRNHQDPAIIIEFKSFQTETDLKTESNNAINQINDKKYYAGLHGRGYRKFILIGIAFHLKQMEFTIKEFDSNTSVLIDYIQEK